MNNLNVTSIVMFMAGVILMYAGVHDTTPLDVVKDAFRKEPTYIKPGKGELGAPTPPREPDPPPRSDPGVPFVTV